LGGEKIRLLLEMVIGVASSTPLESETRRARRPIGGCHALYQPTKAVAPLKATDGQLPAPKPLGIAWSGAPLGVKPNVKTAALTLVAF
jgi:hypothetical protein